MTSFKVPLQTLDTAFSSTWFYRLLKQPMFSLFVDSIETRRNNRKLNSGTLWHIPTKIVVCTIFSRNARIKTNQHTLTDLKACFAWNFTLKNIVSAEFAHIKLPFNLIKQILEQFCWTLLDGLIIAKPKRNIFFENPNRTTWERKKLQNTILMMKKHNDLFG